MAATFASPPPPVAVVFGAEPGRNADKTQNPNLLAGTAKSHFMKFHACALSFRWLRGRRHCRNTVLGLCFRSLCGMQHYCCAVTDNCSISTFCCRTQPLATGWLSGWKRAALCLHVLLFTPFSSCAFLMHVLFPLSASSQPTCFGRCEFTRSTNPGGSSIRRADTTCCTERGGPGVLHQTSAHCGITAAATPPLLSPCVWLG